MTDESFGIVLAAQRARWWAPRLKDHERNIVNAMVLYTNPNGTASPTAEQLAESAGRSIQRTRILLRELSAEGGPLVKVGDRPVYVDHGDYVGYKGGSVGVYAIAPTDRLGDQLGLDFIDESPPDRLGEHLGNFPPARRDGPTRAPDGPHPRAQTRTVEVEVEKKETNTMPGDHPDDQVGRLEGETMADWIARTAAGHHSGIELGPPIEDPRSPCAEGVHEFRMDGSGWSRCKPCGLKIPDTLAEMSA